VDFKDDFNVADYPMEQGAFASYNKVGTPFDFRVTMAYSGDTSERNAFLQTLNALLASTDLYEIRTPEGVWQNVTIANYDYRRDAKSGAQLLTVDVYCREVRTVTQDSYTQQQSSTDQTQTSQTVQTQQDTSVAPFDPANTRIYSASDLKNQGRVQALPPTPAQDAATNHAQSSANDGLNTATSGQVTNWNPGILPVGDMLGNVPAGLSSDSVTHYTSTINMLYNRGGA